MCEQLKYNYVMYMVVFIIGTKVYIYIHLHLLSNPKLNK